MGTTEPKRMTREQLEATLDDLVREWTTGAPDAWVYVHPEKGEIRVGDLDGYVPFTTLADAMAWGRAQGGGK